NVPPTIASTSDTSSTSTGAEIIENVESVPHLQKELSISSGFETLQLGPSSPPFKIWIKYGDSRPVRLTFDGEIVDDLIESIKKKLSPDLNDVALNRITLRKHDEETDLRPGLPVDESFKNDDESPLQVIVNAPVISKRKREESPEDLSEIVKSAVREEFSRKKPADQISASSLSDKRTNKILDDLGIRTVKLSEKVFQPLQPITYQPFVWDMEREEAQQMSNIVTWFKNALKLPRDYHVKDIHTQVTHQQNLPEANVTITGGADISIGPSETDCVWIETKKKEEDFKEGQAVGELFLIDKNHPINSMVVLTDCNDRWSIFFFATLGDRNDEKCIVKAKIDDRGIALAIIKQYVIVEGNKFFKWLGKDASYQVEVDVSSPLQKRIKFFEYIPEADDNNKIKEVGDMSRQESLNIDIRKGLTMLRNWCRLDEQPQVDKLIRQFSDDYENPPPQMFA
ncbi:6711_t:CDS:2, partial [Diversispora eburnea]